MIGRISKTYGPATKPAGEIATIPFTAKPPQSSLDGKTRNIPTTWFGRETVQLRADPVFESNECVGADTINESVRLDALEAPQREIDQQSKHDADERLILERARSEK